MLKEDKEQEEGEGGRGGRIRRLTEPHTKLAPQPPPSFPHSPLPPPAFHPTLTFVFVNEEYQVVGWGGTGWEGGIKGGLKGGWVGVDGLVESS